MHGSGAAVIRPQCGRAKSYRPQEHVLRAVRTSHYRLQASVCRRKVPLRSPRRLS